MTLTEFIDRAKAIVKERALDKRYWYAEILYTDSNQGPATLTYRLYQTDTGEVSARTPEEALICWAAALDVLPGVREIHPESITDISPEAKP